MVDQLIEVFANVLGVEPESLSEETSPANTPCWDSVANIMLVTEIEATFAVELNTAEIESMTSIGRARSVLRQLGASL